MEMLVTGVGFSVLAETMIRVALGVFFLFSGYHKLFNPVRHATVLNTMINDHVPLPWFNCWFVPTVEFLGGMALVIGFLTPLAAFGLFCVCCVATLVDGVKRVKSWQPLDKTDAVDDMLYLPEVLYCFMLLWLMSSGAGPWSLDALIRSIL